MRCTCVETYTLFKVQMSNLKLEIWTFALQMYERLFYHPPKSVRAEKHDDIARLGDLCYVRNKRLVIRFIRNGYAVFVEHLRKRFPVHPLLSPFRLFRERKARDDDGVSVGKRVTIERPRRNHSAADIRFKYGNDLGAGKM